MILTVPQDRALYPTLGPQVCDWMETHLVFGPGDLVGQPLRLDDERRALIYRMYEVYPQGHQWAGRRRFRRAGLSLAKGKAKTETGALIAAAELHHAAPVRCTGWTKRGEPIGGPVTDPYIPLVAYTEEQSDELCYGALRTILDKSPIRDHFSIGLDRIIDMRGGGKAASLSSSPDARDGARTTFCVADETHRWDLPRLKQAHTTMLNNLPKRLMADPWMLELTTAFQPGEGSVAEKTMAYAQAVQAGQVANTSFFFFHLQASDKHQIFSASGRVNRRAAKAAVIEASGAAAKWRDIDGIVAILDDPDTDQAYWERVWCNRPRQGSLQAFDPLLWACLARTTSPVQPGDLITIGFDGSQFHDATGIVCTHVETGYQWVAGLWEQSASAAADARGREVPDWEVPGDEVDACIQALFDTYDVWRLYADPPYWQSYVAKWTADFGEERVIAWHTARRMPMSQALEGFRSAMQARTLSHDGHEAYARHIGHAQRKVFGSAAGDPSRAVWLIQKERHDSPKKIDLAMAGCLSWEARTDAIAAGALEVSDEDPRLIVVDLGP